jgi:hypothetical protein
MEGKMARIQTGGAIESLKENEKPRCPQNLLQLQHNSQGFVEKSK